MRSDPHRVAVAGLLAAVALAAFGAVSFLTADTGNQVTLAQPTVTLTPPPQRPPITPTPPVAPLETLPANPNTTMPGWHVPYLQADALRPMFDQVINGITVGPSAEHQIEPACQPGTAQRVPLEQAVGTPVMIQPKYVPAGANRLDSESWATACETAGGERVIVATDTAYVVPSDPKTGRRGGIVTISRWRGAPSATVAIPAERWTAGRIAGHPAAIARPILANGLGRSAVVVHADGVVTKVEASWLPLDEAQRIAEGLF